MRDVQARGRKNFRERSVRADQIDDESPSRVVADPLVRQQIANVKKIARVLPIERGHDLAAIEVRKRDDLDFREAEFLLDPRRNAANRGFVDATPQDRGHFDLDRYT